MAGGSLQQEFHTGQGGSRQPAEVVGKIGVERRGRGEVTFGLVATGQPHDSLAGR